MAIPSSARVQTLEKGLQLLEYIVERKSVTVTSVANAFGIHKSAAHRFLTTLRYTGYLEQERQGEYVLTNRIEQLAKGVIPRIEARNLARHHLEALSKLSEQPSNFGHWDGRLITYLDQKVFKSAVDGLVVGTRIPAYCSAMGKAILAYLPEKELDDYLEKADLAALTDKTETDPDAIRRQLALVRERGYALMDSEMVANLVGVAAPVFNKNGYPRYAVSVGGFIFTDVPGFVEKVARHVVERAREISEFLRHAETMEDK